MKKINLKCSNCSGNMKISDDKTMAFCPYCQSSFLLEKKETIEELSKKAEKLSYARKSGENKAIEDSIRRQKKRKLIATLITIGLLFLIISVGLLINYFSLEYIEDPFDCISIEFVGKNGEGKTKITDTKQCQNYTEIDYNFSKDSKLNEGEKIKVIATSDIYRFDISTKEYIVNGLSMYLVNLDDLNDEISNKLHDFSYNHLKNNLGITFDGEVVNLTPYKLFLYTNGENENILYDVYKISIKTQNGNIYDKFVVAYYENFIILNNNELFSYDRQYHCGNTILAGDPNTYNAISENYAGFITGFKTIDDFKSYINKDNDGTFEIKER